MSQKKALTQKQRDFCKNYIKSSNGTQSAIKAGYAKRNAHIIASKLLSQDNIQEEIRRLNAKSVERSIASGAEVMDYFTRVMRGEIKDQFGLEASLSERTRAAQELAKRTIDLDNRLNGKPDTTMEIKLNWNR